MIKVLTTGGTLDKVYNELTGELVFTETCIPELLKRARCSVDISVDPLFQKDSLEMDDADRARILEYCIACDESQILITHGTDTMVETAAVLGREVVDKTIVLVGAMIPYSITHSDALFNVGFALAAVQYLEPGVYIAMNGQVFSWDNATKNRSEGVFKPAS